MALYYLGVVDKVIKSIEDRIFPDKKEGLKFMDKFLKEVLDMSV